MRFVIASKWARLDSNQGPTDYELAAGPRPTETLRGFRPLSRLLRLRRRAPISSSLGPSPCHFLATPVERLRRRQVVVEQVDVAAQREAGVGVAEEALHLDGVPARAKQQRRPRVPEGVEADRGLGPQPALAVVDPDLSPPDWRPRYVDYLALGFTTSTAFSPTDVMPMSAWAKLGMALQALIALIIVGLVIARAVNVLP